MEALEFNTALLDEEADRLRAAARSAQDALDDLKRVPRALLEQLGDGNPLPGHLERLLRRCAHTQAQCASLSGALTRAAEIYREAEQAVQREAEALPSPGSASGARGVPVRAAAPPFTRPTLQFGGDFAIDDWLARVLLEQERET